MSRRTISGNVPADIAERISDIDDDYTPEEENEIERRTDEIIAKRILWPEYWGSILEGINHLTDELPRQIARCMANIDLACKADEIAIRAITTALSILQAHAKITLRPEAREQAEREYAEGDE